MLIENITLLIKKIYERKRVLFYFMMQFLKKLRHIFLSIIAPLLVEFREFKVQKGFKLRFPSYKFVPRGANFVHCKAGNRLSAVIFTTTHEGTNFLMVDRLKNGSHVSQVSSPPCKCALDRTRNIHHRLNNYFSINRDFVLVQYTHYQCKIGSFIFSSSFSLDHPANLKAVSRFWEVPKNIRLKFLTNIYYLRKWIHI